LQAPTSKQETIVTDRAPAPDTGYDDSRIVHRPDGYYWRAEDGVREYGPFPTLHQAVDDMQRDAAGELEIEPGETLQEAESELGIADWIDPDTGEPGEEDGTRTEQH
jgi:hypothetical protein